jgi:CelD/BcsL family acetyltransferase involved in cellulose biosynthesis
VSYEIRWVEGNRAFAALAPSWERLVAGSAAPPFVSHAWFSAWYDAFAAEGPLVCTAWREGQLAAVLPLRSAGGVLGSATNAHTPVFAPLGDDDAVQAVLVAAVEAAGGSLVVTHLPEEHPATAALAEASRGAGRITWTEPGPRSAVAETAGGLESYLRGRPRDTRRELGRLRRKLAKEQRATLEVLSEPSALAVELQACFELEAAGWKGRRGTAILSSPDTARFYRAVADAFARRGELRLSTISVEGRPIAFDLGLVSGRRLWVPKGGYDETFRRYGPGLVLLLAEVEQAFELGLEAVELLGEAEPYKQPFATTYRRHCAVHSHRWRPVPLARLSYRRAARPILRRVYRKLRTR